MIQKRICIHSDTPKPHGIPVIITCPEEEPKAILIMCHGTGTDKNEAGNGYVKAAEILADTYHVITLRFDFMGSGESEADYADYCFDSAVDDVMSVLAFARREISSGLPAGLLGWSQGGTDVLLSLGYHPEAFAFGITWAGAPDLSSMMNDEQYREAMENGYFTMEFDWRSDLHAGRQWAEDVRHKDVLQIFSRYTGPVLAIAGEDDDVVPPVWAEKIIQNNSHPSSHALIIPGADHTYRIFEEDDQHTLVSVIEASGQFIASL